MKKITFIAYDQCMSSAIYGLLDAFSMANVWIQQKAIAKPASTLDSGPLFEMEIVSLNGGGVLTNGNLLIQASRKLDDAQDADLLFIPPHLCGFDPDKAEISRLVPWIQEQYQKKTRIGAICTGVSILAQTGLLDGRLATTNWQIIKNFRKRFPKVNLKPERVLTDDNGLICAGAVTAQYNLALHIISLFGSEDLARDCAKIFLVDPNRNTQAPYMITTFIKNHGDNNILKVQNWMETHYSEEFTLEDLAKMNGMSSRHFKRRFKKATSTTPLRYLQQLRVEVAKNKLETTNENIDEITQQIGYNDSRTFRRLFKTYTSLSPREYRDKFRMT